MIQEMQTVEIADQLTEIDELTPEEEYDRLYLERRVERAFYEAGKALTQLRDRRLYRSTHKTFEDYCRDRFGYTRMAASYKIAAATVIDNLSTNGLQNGEMSTNGLQILPTNERQVRPLTKLEPQQQQEIWQAAVEEAGGKAPSGRIVKDVIERIMESTKVPNTYQLGEVCQIIVKDNPDLRGKGGCWAIVTGVNDFTCTVMAWDGEYTVRMDHLKPMNYLDKDCEQMQLISERISRLRNHENLEETAVVLLKQLGQIKRPYLTRLEEKMLSLIELECACEQK